MWPIYSPLAVTAITPVRPVLCLVRIAPKVIITERNVLSAKQGSRKLICFTVSLTVGEGNNQRIFQPTPY